MYFPRLFSCCLHGSCHCQLSAQAFSMQLDGPLHEGHCHPQPLCSSALRVLLALHKGGSYLWHLMLAMFLRSRFLMPSLQPYGGKGWTLACLLPPSSISLYANILLKLESAQRGISRETLHLSVNSQSPFSAATVFRMLLLDILLYAVLTWYFDQV